MAKTNSFLNRKYRLHTKLRKKSIRYNSNDKTVFFSINNVLDNKDILELQQKFNYQIQFEIPQ